MTKFVRNIIPPVQQKFVMNYMSDVLNESNSYVPDLALLWNWSSCKIGLGKDRQPGHCNPVYQWIKLNYVKSNRNSQ